MAHTTDTPKPRQNKVARLVQKELAEMFLKYAKDWIPGVLVSVSSVRVSPDFALAKVYVSIFPSEKAEKVLESLNHHNKEIRYQLGQRVKNQLRIVPEIALFIDDSLDYIENIDKLLKE
jgi:ribosome-binding factor A